MKNNLILGDPINLPTQFGDFQARYIDSGSQTGVCLYRMHDVKSSEKLHPLFRVQSSCLFSESFWATDCDCSLQLREAMERITKEGGLLIYFYEEGRGAGLKIKMEAISLEQKYNYDTKEAYECLDVNPDARNDYTIVDQIVSKIIGKKAKVRLLTNNPYKEKLIRDAGVNIVSIEQLVCITDNPRQKKYLEDKQKVLGHNIFIELSDSV